MAQNVLMIVADDLNQFVPLLGGYAALGSGMAPVATPNLDRLAGMGVSFTNAHAVIPLCNPSRSAVMSGMSPLSSGLLSNAQPMLSTIPESRTLPALLDGAGYETVTAGKVFHGLNQDQAERLHDVVLSLPSIQTFDNVIPTASSLQAGIFAGEDDELTDGRNVARVEDFLAGYRPDPDGAGLFLTVGLTSTHVPLLVPQPYFDLHPLDQIVPPANPPGDLDDLPDFARQFLNARGYQRITAADDWRPVVQAYLATISYLDAMVGRLLDALEASAIAGNTLVVFWSDNGLHLGEKGHFGKITLWDSATLTPLIIADPSAPARHGTVIDAPVSLLDLYPTLLEAVGVAVPPWADGQSLLDAVRTGDTGGLRDGALSMIDGSFSLRTAGHRLTLYEDGSVELYDARQDPQEYVNLAGHPDHAVVQAALTAALLAEIAGYPVLQNRTVTPQLLAGGAGNDILIAGLGADTLAGGAGDDAYLLRPGSAEVVEAAGGGRDIVMISGVTAYVMPAHVEDLFHGRYGAGAPMPPAVTLLGNDLPNNIRDMEGNALVADGGPGNDTIANDMGPATISGGAGSDVLSSDVGDDLLMGGDGNDRLLSRGGQDTLDGGAGTDSLIGGDGSDRLEGGAGDDMLRGEEDGDTYVASAGIDRIEETGILGTDLLDLTPWGGLAGTTITEQRDAAGQLAAILLARTGGGGSITVAALAGRNPIEALLDHGVIVLAGATTFLGTGAAERVVGTRHGDTISGEDGNDTVEGRAGDDSLAGGAGADSLRGGAGADTLALGQMAGDGAFGGGGGDLFLVAAGSGAVSGGTGLDTLRLTGAAGTLALIGIERVELGPAGVIAAAGLAVSGVVEVVGLGDGATLSLAGGAAVDLSGLALAGLVVAGDGFGNVVALGANAVRAAGGGGGDRLSGGAGAQTLEGGEGRDTLQGGPGADRLAGGPDDDLYIVDRADSVLDTGGSDTVQSDGPVTMAAGIEVLLLTGSAAVQGTGNALDNLMTGNDGSNLLSGGAGDDTLAGGFGTDRLAGGPGADVLRLASAAEGWDSLVGFDGREDVVELSAAGFGGGLRAGMDLLAENRYREATTPTATSAAGVGQFILETDARLLWWDADGSGAAFGPVRILLLGDAVEWGAADIRIIA